MLGFLPIALSLAMIVACGSRKKDGSDAPSSQPPVDEATILENAATHDPKPQDPSTSSESPAKKNCQNRDGVLSDPQTIAQVIDLVNALPKPVSIPCFVESLKRPLYINATSSSSSIQPAVSAQLPRLFIFLGPSLIATFVPSGKGSAMVELSYLVSETSSIKGEIDFPVAANLPANAAYKSILDNAGTGTTCSGCHLQEVRAPESFGAGAFVSAAFKPLPSHNVDLESLIEFTKSCAAPASGAACEIMGAVFSNGEVKPKDFPAGMQGGW